MTCYCMQALLNLVYSLTTQHFGEQHTAASEVQLVYHHSILPLYNCT